METNKNNILCHLCRWGATPGKMSHCQAPKMGNDVFKYFASDPHRAQMVAFGKMEALRIGVNDFNPVAFALPVYATLNNLCPHFEKRSPDLKPYTTAAQHCKE